MVIVLFVSTLKKDTEQLITVLPVMKPVIPLTDECSDDKLELDESEDLPAQAAYKLGFDPLLLALRNIYPRRS